MLWLVTSEISKPVGAIGMNRAVKDAGSIFRNMRVLCLGFGIS